MKRRKWTPEGKLAVVLEGVAGRPVSEICAEHEISQSQYYRWRDQFFDGAHRAFVKNEQDSRVGKLERENVRLKALVAEFALDAKKNGGWFE